ncbi:MAG TPA: DUF308 domain-containing protein [Caldilineaceae bacterium]|nr:DUF308 domain-containing protein [Caldilineaceae bacterium]
MQATITPNTPAREAAAYAWWVILLWGIATVIVGAYLLVRPSVTALLLVQFMGAYWLVGGIFDLFGSMTQRMLPQRGWRLIGAVISVLAGFVILGNPLMGTIFTVGFMYYMLAISAIVNGVINMLIGNQVRGLGKNEWSWSGFLLGLLQLIIGLFLLTHPLAGALSLVPLLGGLTLIGGIATIVIAFRLRTVVSF